MQEKLKEIMSNIFDIPKEKINDSTSMKSVDKWDSLSHINLILSIEENFQIEISEDEMSQMTSYKTIKEILKRKL